MNEVKDSRIQLLEVDMERLLRLIFDRLWLIFLTALLCAAMAYSGTSLLVTPMYRSSAMFYVNYKSFSVDGMLSGFTSDEIRTARSLVDTYVVILDTRQTLKEVIEYAEADIDAENLRKRLEVEYNDVITADSVNETEIFRISVNSPDPREAERIANAITVVLPQRIDSIIEGAATRVVETAVIPAAPSSPNARNNLILGGLFGGVLGVGIIALRELFDAKIRSESELINYTGIPVLSVIPDLLGNTEREDLGYRGGYSYRK